MLKQLKSIKNPKESSSFHPRQIPKLRGLPSSFRFVLSTPSETACLPTKVWKRPSLAAPSTTSWPTLSSASRTQRLRYRSSTRWRERTRRRPSATLSSSHRRWLGCPTCLLFRPRPTRTITPWTVRFRYTRTLPGQGWLQLTQRDCRRVREAHCTAWKPHSEALLLILTTSPYTLSILCLFQQHFCPPMWAKEGNPFPEKTDWLRSQKLVC